MGIHETYMKWLRAVPKQKAFPREYYLQNLREIDIDNLKIGRITRQTIDEVLRRVKEHRKTRPYHNESMLIADELNDMLEAAK